MYALPDYFLRDIMNVQQALNEFAYHSEELVLEIDTFKVNWGGDPDSPAGEFRREPRSAEYIFWVNEDTLKGLTEGHSED